MDIKEKIQSGQLVTGLWVQSGSPVAAEIFAEAGADFVALDMEHSDANEAGFTAFARALGGKAVAFARVRENDTLAIRRVLDMGAQGIIVPLVNSAAQAAQAVAATCYPPDGVRGYAFCRANQWGLNFDEYRTGEGSRIAVIVMVESVAAVDAIDEILQVPGLDGILIGPYDLSGSYGVPGQLQHPDVLAGMEKVVAACKVHKKAAGLHVVTPTAESVQNALQQGYTFLPMGMDTVYMRDGAQATMKLFK